MKGAVGEGAQTSNILLQTDVTVNPDCVCTEGFCMAPLIASQMCAGVLGNQPHDACQGDSGGPLVKRDNNGQFWLAGVVRFVANLNNENFFCNLLVLNNFSFSISCSTGVGCAGHGIYSRVSEFEQWISETVKMN